MSSSLIIDSQFVPEVPSESQTLIELLRSRMYQQPGRHAYTFLIDEGTGESNLTYGELDRQARAIGAWLQLKVVPGDRVLLLYPPGLEYIAAFFGCLYAGAIAVPAYPPRNNRNLLRLQTLVRDARATVALTTSPILSRITPQLSQNSYLTSLVWQAADQIAEGIEDNWQEPSLNGEALALLQYTSGSTSAPKGVMVSHRNLLHNEQLIQRVFQQTDQSVIVGWLPLYHDMGLIGNVIQPLFVGAPCILMSPTAFLQKPFRWLQAISQYRATTSGGPNFAYDLCVRKISDEQRATLDLSSWRVAFNGSEPIRQESLERFAEAFAPCGFRRDAFQPCYGLAEATLLVSGRTSTEPLVTRTVQASALEKNRVVEATSEDDGKALVSCGGALAGQEVVIVDPETLMRCAPGHVGEIWVSGPSVAQGYWNNPEETERIFRAHLSDTGEGPFLRTGDLGFLLSGELFVTGRLKDLIIIRGLNHYPQDIELTVERCHPVLRPGCGAAFSIDMAGEERLVIVQEVDHRQQFDAETLIENINEAVASEHEAQAHDIVLVKLGTIPKTSSGKIQRYACREAFLQGTLAVLAEQRGDARSSAQPGHEPLMPDARDAEAVELWLRTQVAAKLGVDPQKIDVGQPLARYGLDSLTAVELAHTVEINLGVEVPFTAFLQGSSIATLAARALEQRQSDSAARWQHPGETTEVASEPPLSAGQRALWFLHQVEPESAAYNIVGAARVLSKLDVPALRRAFQRLVARHPSLRTTFESHDGKPVQKIRESVEVDFSVQDASAWDETAVSKYLTNEAHRPFDLEAGPLLRVRLLSQSDQEQVLLLSLHHIITDHWSLALVMNELGVLYEAERTGVLAQLPHLARQYSDYVRWQEEILSGASGARLLSYWEKQLAGEPPPLNLPTDRPRPPVQTYRGASHTFRLDADLARSLKELGHAHEATLYTTLLAAFQVLLHCYTDQEDILVGSPTAGRGPAEFAGLVGYFVNPVVIRADLAGNPPFETVLDRARRTVLEAFEHQEYPFPLLAERLQPVRDASRSPIFQAMFTMQNMPLANGEGLTSLALGEAGARLELGSLRLESLALEQQAAMFDITLRMAEVEGGLAASLQYNTDLFDAATIARMVGHFQTLLEGIVADPHQRLSELPLLTEAESRLLAEWNETERDYGHPRCLHELFEEQVARTPEAVAVVFEGERLSYAELNERANQLANRLLQSGVGPEVRVGLCAERSAEMVIGLLGILKAGGAYVPLDPQYPQERLAFMLEDSGIEVILTQRRLRDALPAHRAHLLYLDEPQEQAGGPVVEREIGPRPSVSPENLCYVIYTSGSTGQPKGAMNTHQAVFNRLLWMQEAYGLGPADCVLQKTPFTFDVSVWEFFWPLMVGARLVVARPEGHQDPAYLARLIAAEQVTTLHFVPSMLQLFLDEPEVSRCRSLRRVICSGEALPLSLQERFFELSDAELHNLYGPTEAAVDVTFWACERGGGRFTVPIGRPIANTQIHLLDRYLRPTPIGVTGELYIGGRGVGRGYCDQPEMTAQRFIPDPFGDAGARLYKTGDLARYLPDGSIEFLGRVDHQVKLRGLRIELGEIEAALTEHLAVQEAVVIVREYGPGDQRLVAYLVPDAQEAPVVRQLLKLGEGGQADDQSVYELRKDIERYLRERLPSYMVPSAFVFLDRLPTVSNGKVNRRALPAPKQERPELAENFVGPRNATEETLAAIWARVLRVARVGIYDNFFELGGDSILSIQIVAQANRAGLKLTPRQLFQYQTIAQLAEVADTSLGIQAEQVAVTGAVPLTPVQRWFFEQQLPSPHHWNQAVLLEVRRTLNPLLLERAIKQLLAHHDALRMRFTRGESGWEQFNAPVEEAAPFSVIDLSAVAESEQRDALEATVAQLHASLNLSTGPLLRAAYFDFGPEKPGNLLLVIHHLVVDGISWRIILEDLQLAYQQESRGETVSLQPKTTSFKTWAEGLTEYALSAAIEREIPYWLTVSSQPTFHLPLDFQGGPNTEASARTVSATLSSEETRALLHEVPSAYRTYINEVLLSALAWSFSQLTGESSLLIDLEGHGREEQVEGADLSRTVGWFTAIYPVQLKLEKPFSPVMMLTTVKEQLRQIPNHGVGYGVSRYLRKDDERTARLQALPQAEVAFNYLGQLDQVFGDSGLFENALEIDSPSRSPQGQRRYLLEINASIIGGRLKLSWTYSENAHHRATIEGLAQNFLKALQEIIVGSGSGEAYHFTPADFPLTKIDQSRLVQLLEKYADIEDVYPLAPVQQGLLFHSLYDAVSGIYVEQLSCILRGKLNVPAFERAWQKVIERHSILRTAFVWENLEEPLQVVSREVSSTLATDDWRGLSASEQAQRFDSFLQADRAQGFDLQTAPLMRLALFRVSDDAHRFVWSHHHLLLDGWSLPIVLNEVFAFYEEFSKGRELWLKPAPPYLNYIDWLREQDLAGSEAFWRQALEGFSTPTPLTLDRAHDGPLDPANVYGEEQAHLSLAATTALQTFAQRHHLTLNTLLQGAWALLLNQYSGAGDVVFGTAVSGRPVSLPEVQSMVGIFINTLPVRVQIPVDGSLSSWLRELQEKQSELQKHEHTPLVQIQGWSEVPRGISLFESVLVLLNYPITDALRESERSLSIEEVSWLEQTNYPLTMQVTPGRELLLKVAYDPYRFDAPTIERILGHFQTVLEAIAAEPEPRLADVSLLTQAERQQLLLEWNDTRRDYAGQQCLHELFEEQAERTPDAIAVSYEDEKVSYAELNRRANQLANHLRNLGVGTEVLVGICVERSIEMVVGLLGILKAGAAYVPLDPSYPLERLAFMLEDVAPGVLLTQERLVEMLPSHWGHTICLDSDWAIIAEEDTGNLPGAATQENLAYVIYTSGSTGKPKGAMLNHGGIVNCLRWMQDTYQLDESDRFLFKTSLNFDPSVWELFWTWWTGGRVVVARPEGHLDSAYLVETIVRERVTSVYFVPPMLRVFVEEAGVENATSLRRVICGGEGLPKETMERFCERLSGAELHHSYGPTEASIAATEWLCERGANKGMAPIGRPLANTQIYLLNDRLQPVPVGASGELYIGGVGVGRGYLNRPELTAERFIPDPFSQEPGVRLYRTGDVGRYLPDGNIEFLGRTDSQVKIRGYRIELGEIEAALASHPAVETAVVAVREEEGGDKQLVAYVLVQAEAAATTGDLRSYLRERLPDYMVPAWIVTLDELPLTANGKVDRRALPTPETIGAEQERKVVLPRTPIEEVLAGIWEEVLGVTELSATANFFELGGHSLLATQVMLRVREAFGVEMQLRSLFEFPTVRGLASQIEETINAKRGLAVPVLAQVKRNGEIPLSYAQQRLWFADQLTPDSVLYNVSAAVRLSGQLDTVALEQTLAEIIRRHEVLRTSFSEQKGKPIQVIAPSINFTLPVIDLRGIPASERDSAARRLAAEEAERPFDLTCGPLLRAQLLRLEEEEHIALFTMHHIISDGWSMGLLIKEVSVLYEAYSRGEESPLEELAIQYADYAAWQREWLTGEVLEGQLEYWQEQLQGAPQVLELPTDNIRPAVQSFRGAQQEFSLTPELSEKLRELSRREGVSLFMTLLAAWQTLLHYYTRQEQINVGTPIAGRSQLATENLIGFFVNTVVMSGELSGNPSFEELLGRVREMCLGAYANQDVPFEKIVELLQPERDLSRSPLFQVWFTLVDAPLEKLQLKNLKLQEFAFEAVTAKFDLALLVTDAGKQLGGVLEYNSDLFNLNTINRMLRHLDTLLSSIVAEPQSQLDVLLEILAEEDRKHRSTKAQEFKAADRQILKSIKRKVISG